MSFTRETIDVPGARAVLRREPWDCERLQVETAKVEQVSLDNEEAAPALDAAVTRVARANGFTLLAGRVDASQRLTLGFFSAYFRLLDTVVTLELPLEAEPPTASLAAGYSIRVATAPDRAAVGELSADAFSDPRHSFNRYLNDPFIPLDRVRDVYRTWGATSIDGPAADRTWVACCDAEVVGFLTLKLAAAGLSMVSLNAVALAHRGKGLYGALLNACLKSVWSEHGRRVAVVTQVQQLAVQHAWLRLGAMPTATAHSFHRWLGSGPPARSLA